MCDDTGSRRRASWRALALVVLIAGTASLGASALASESLSVQVFDEDGNFLDMWPLRSISPD
jgi:hypothetical protein